MIVAYSATEILVPLTPTDNTGAPITGLVYNSAGLTIDYRKSTDASWTSITLVTATAGTYTSSGFVEVDSGDYQLGLPSAALNPGGHTLVRFTYGANDPQFGTIEFTFPSAYAKNDVAGPRVWSWPEGSSRVQSPKIVKVHPDFDGTLAFDMSGVLNEGAGIDTVVSITVSPSGPTVSNITKSSDNQEAMFDIDGGQSDATDYTFTITCTTTDSDDALPHTGLMQSRSS